MVGYLIISVTAGSDYENDLDDTAKHLDVAVNKLPASVNAVIVQDHTAYTIVTNIYLLLPPVLLLIAALRLRGATRAPRYSAWSVDAGVVGLVVWWFYIVLNFGLYADANDLPPLVRDLDDLTVPLVSIMSVLTLLVAAFAGEATRRSGLLRRAAWATLIVSVILLVLSAVEMIASGFDDPIPPLIFVPPGLILGIALLVRKAPQPESA